MINFPAIPPELFNEISVQTFLPYADFDATAKVLDYRRLGNQRVEGYQILQALRGLSFGWRNHPASKMWRGHERMLCGYVMAICQEWRRRGYKDSFLERMHVVFPTLDPASYTAPSWLGDEQFHLAHQSNLVRKDPKYYGPIFPGVPDNLPYIWPVP